MKDNNSHKMNIKVEDSKQKQSDSMFQSTNPNKMEKLKKPIIFGLMAIVFAGCMYLIFKPSGNKDKVQDIGLNIDVPQASDAGMQSNKQKAYEEALLEERQQERKSGLLSLSDYWNNDTEETDESDALSKSEGSDGMYSTPFNASNNNGNSALNSYRNAQSTLQSFYGNDKSENQELRNQIDNLKQQLSDRDAVPQPFTINDQLTLMEKSYEMASKYLPSGSNPKTDGQVVDTLKSNTTPSQKEMFVAFTPARKTAVSALYRELSNNEFLENVNGDRNWGFYTTGTSEQVSQPKNSIRACVQATQVISGESVVKLRLLEAAKTQHYIIPVGTILAANAKFNNSRLALKINSIELEGNIIPVDISIHDLDGQIGLHVPYSPETNAMNEIASNMGQSAGTSIMMARSAGQQMAGDLSRGLVQGVTGYFSKKVRTPKVTLKAGHQVLLVSKK